MNFRNLWFKTIGALVYRRLLILERPLTQPIPDIEARVPLSFGLLAEDGFDEYRGLVHRARRETWERRFRTGELCFSARDSDGTLVCVNWAATRESFVSHLDREIRVPDGEVYLHGSFTRPAMRGRRIAPALAVWILEHFRTRRCRRMTTLVEPWNRANLKARARSGYRVCGSTGYVRLGPWRWAFTRDESPDQWGARRAEAVTR